MPGIVQAIRSFFGRKPRNVRAFPPPRSLSIKARYDAAQTNNDNRRHWAAADDLSALAANSPEVRRTLRKRSRYEIANNSYARGIVLTLANDTIGTGPRLQSRTGDETLDEFIEVEFAKWAKQVRLAEKLRVARMSKAGDGEAFIRLIGNPRLPKVQTDLMLIEADQIASPSINLFDPNDVDGIRFDVFGNPIAYSMLTQHPGDGAALLATQFTTIPAAQMIHWQRIDRPGQSRGVPEITAALGLFADLRRFTAATIAAAETAADFAGMVTSTAPAGDEDVEPEAMDTIEIEKRMLTVLPKGWGMSQMKAEHPATTYEMFVKQILKEIARCLNMPFNVAAGDSSGYNYSSGRLDHQTYFKSIRVEQVHCEQVVLDRIFEAWYFEASRLTGYFPVSAKQFPDVPHEWFWDGNEHVDPTKESNADDVDLKNGTATMARIKGRAGIDWQSDLEQLAKEVRAYEAVGLVHPFALQQKQLEQKQQAADQAASTDSTATADDEAMLDTELEDEEALADA